MLCSPTVAKLSSFILMVEVYFFPPGSPSLHAYSKAMMGVSDLR